MGESERPNETDRPADPGKRTPGVHAEPEPRILRPGEFDPGFGASTEPLDDEDRDEPFSPVNEPDPGPLPEGPSRLDDA